MKKPSLLIIVALLVVLSFSYSTFSQNTEISYQGSLESGGNPASGNHDFEFVLFDALAGGNQVGAVVTVNNVIVTNGIFAVNLDFGNQFPGANRFLEIRVRPAGQPGITVLSPRQLLNSTPYSVKSLTAETATTATNATQLGGVAANQFVVTTDPRMTNARTPTAGSGDYIQNRNTQQTATNFNISGNGTAAGTLAGNIVNATTQYNVGGNRVLSVAGSNNVLVGVGAGAVNTGSSNAFFGAQAGDANTTGASNSFFGRGAGGVNMTGGFNAFFGGFAGAANTGGSNVFFGYSAGLNNTSGSSNTLLGTTANVGAGNLSNATALGAEARVDCSNCLVLGSVGGFNGASTSPNVGIGTTSPDTKLEVVNNGVSAAHVFITSYGNINNAIIGRQAGGTLTAPTAAGSGLSLLFLGGRGHTGTGFATVSRVGVNMEAAENWTATANGTRITFDTTANGSTSRTERMRIDHNGSVGIGTTTPSSFAKLHVVQTEFIFPGTAAIRGESTAGSSTGVEGVANIDSGSIGIRGSSSLGRAGLFTGDVDVFGDVDVIGTLSKSSGAFKIDHPLDPANKYLYHSFVESPDMKNIYDGNVTTDAVGEAEVVLPDWFQALNRDFRYQLTVIGQFAQAIVAEEIKDNRFKIRTSLPQVKVSWQVTGIRQDAYAERHRIPVEVVKPEKERGSYLHPKVFDQAEEKGIEWVRRPEEMKRMKDAQEKSKEAAREPGAQSTPGSEKP